jgi:WD repeat-containing protein 48
VQEKNGLNRGNAPMNITIPQTALNGWRDAISGPTSGSTIRPANGFHLPVTTPGLAIGLATPGIAPSSAGHGSLVNHLTPTTEEGTQLERTQTQRSSANIETPDYFSSAPPPAANGNGKPAASTEGSTDSAPEALPLSPSEETPAKKSKALFSKKFNMSFNMKKFGTSSTAEAVKPAVVDEKSEDSDSRSTKTDDKVLEDNFLGALQKIRQGYEEQVGLGAQSVMTQITPSLPNETPVLKPPAATTILIQEDRPDSGGVADLVEGKVGSLHQQADLIEKFAPVWLADVLLRVRPSPPLSLQFLSLTRYLQNQIPLKEVVKVSFILEPFQNLLPSISSDGYIPLFVPSDKVVRDANAAQSNNRLNANRMLRARKILAYVAERIEPAPTKEEDEAGLLKPEEYLELYCQNQVCCLGCCSMKLR